MIQEKKKINIQVLSYVHEGGEWISTLRLIKATKRLKPDYTFSLVGFTSGYRTNDKVFSKITYLKYSSAEPPFSFLKKLFFDFQNVKNILTKKEGQRKNADIFLITDYLFIPSLFLLNKLRNNNIFYYFHGIRSIPNVKLRNLDYRQLILKFIEFLSLTLSGIIISPSTAAEKYIRSKLGPLGKLKRIFLIPNSIDPDFIKIIPKGSLFLTKKILGIPKKNKVILYSGRIAPGKGLENLIDAFELLSRKLTNVSFIIAYPQSSADDDLLSLLKAKVKVLRLKNKAIFLTDTKRIDLSRIYRISDVLVLASEFEMAPLVIIEALICKTPCIGTRVGNIPEILSQIEPGLLLENNSPEEVAEKIIYFFKIPKNKLNKIKVKGYKFAKNYFPVVSAKKFISLLESSSL